MIATTLSVANGNGDIVSSFDNCLGATVELPVGTYDYTYSVVASGALALNNSIQTETSFAIASFQPLLVWNEDAPASLAGMTVNLSNAEEMAIGGTQFSSVENPTYHTNPKALDAKLTYAMFIPCLTFGAMVFILLRSMGR